MSGNDIYQSLNDLPADALQRVVDRLEFRGKDPSFVRMRENYFDRMDLSACDAVLDVGCGTGVASRALARRDDFHGRVLGIDFSQALIDAASDFARSEGVSDRLTFRVGNSHALAEADNSFDAVLAHTLVSHVTDPVATIADAARVLAPGGILAIFDGDYASLTYGAGDSGQNAEMVTAILDTVVGNPLVMRELPAMLKDQGLEIVDFIPEVLAEAGQGSFYVNLAESYIPIVARAEKVPEADGLAWLSVQKEASAQRVFFAACNFYTYLAKKPG